MERKVAEVTLLATIEEAYGYYRHRGMGRRTFLRMVAGLLALPTLTPAVGIVAQARLPNGVAAGDVTQTSAVLWARASGAGTITFVYGRTQDLAAPDGTLTANVTDTTIPARVLAESLLPGTRYYYRATDAGGASATGSFRTPRAVGAVTQPNRGGFRMGVSGDWRGELAPYPAISNAAGRDLDLFVLHGDTIYADYASPAVNEKPLAETLADYRAKHAEVYGERFGVNSWAALRATTALLATIDDHEVINDFSGGAPRTSDPRFAGDSGELISDTQRFKNGLQAFQEYNPLHDEFYGETGEARTAKRRKLYRYRTYGNDAAVFVLDSRSFRDTPVASLTNFTSPTAIAAFLATTFTPGRTMLGKAQLDELLNDLLASERAGITWKFILVPEPMQNLGPLGAPDRFEGYAVERTIILKFIADNKLTNVVFVAADIHGTVVNDVRYQTAAGQPHQVSNTFEISTGSVAFDAPFGPTVIDLAQQLGVLTAQQRAVYDAADTAGKNAFVAAQINAQIQPLGYPSVGLDNSSPEIKATLVSGSYVAVHTFGWTEFEVEAATQLLRVKTYGITPYTRAEMEANPQAILARQPAVVNEFTVEPQQRQRYEAFMPLVRN